ncbi:hypothetical protein DHW03_01885 [Pedobacter yonginense]|uniref:Uncharacterized protein n=1 Tax=Pedobacter yonginense TaxID=651869 RepID=A0A317ETQ9_9SPHI|nr:hypothetical protein DHW03_01885 [Pedobacter yonginense]
MILQVAMEQRNKNGDKNAIFRRGPILGLLIQVAHVHYIQIYENTRIGKNKFQLCLKPQLNVLFRRMMVLKRAPSFKIHRNILEFVQQCNSNTKLKKMRMRKILERLIVMCS